MILVNWKGTNYHATKVPGGVKLITAGAFDGLFVPDSEILPGVDGGSDSRDVCIGESGEAPASPDTGGETAGPDLTSPVHSPVVGSGEPEPVQGNNPLKPWELMGSQGGSSGT